MAAILNFKMAAVMGFRKFGIKWFWIHTCLDSIS